MLHVAPYGGKSTKTLWISYKGLIWRSAWRTSHTIAGEQLMDLKSSRKMSFLTHYIVHLTQESLHWAKISKQSIIFFKLDLSKAYDKVSWHFCFRRMHKMNISKVFTKWIIFLIIGATAAINFKRILRLEGGYGKGVCWHLTFCQ